MSWFTRARWPITTDVPSSYRVDDIEPDSLVPMAADLLSESTRQLGFVAVPALDRVVLQHVSLVRLSTERVLAILVSRTGTT